jgi:raffinose/stachyose/melibiose transport system permease protein
MSRKWPEYTRYAILIVLALLAIFPIFFLLINSTKTELEFSANPLSLPTSFNWDNYTEAFDIISRPILNSVIIVLASVFGIITFA